MRSFLAAVAALLVSGGIASAQDAIYTSDDVTAAVTANTAICYSENDDVCYGPAALCGAPVTARPEPTGFNLRVTFELDSDRLTPQAEANLREFALAVNGASLIDTRFLIAGHTDARASDGYNLDLSQRRAASVVRYLVELGVDPARLVPEGFGESQLLLPEDPFNGANRRVEAVLL